MDQSWERFFALVCWFGVGALYGAISTPDGGGPNPKMVPPCTVYSLYSRLHTPLNFVSRTIKITPQSVFMSLSHNI